MYGIAFFHVAEGRYIYTIYFNIGLEPNLLYIVSVLYYGLPGVLVPVDQTTASIARLGQLINRTASARLAICLPNNDPV